jgi:hypothetical protein
MGPPNSGHGLAASRGKPLKFGEGCGAPGQARKLFEKIPFRPGPTLRAAVIQERPTIGPVQALPVLAPDGRAGLASPGPGTPASPQACRPIDLHPTPYLCSTPGRHQMDEVAAPFRTAADEHTRSTAPQGREGRRP